MRTGHPSPWNVFFDDRAANDQTLRLVLDRLPEPLALHARCSGGDFRFVAVNRAFERLWRVPVDELIDQPLSTIEAVPLVRRWISLYRELGEDDDSGRVATAVDTVACPAASGEILPVRSNAFRAGRLYGVTLAVGGPPETVPPR
jgi:PAS domain-containing protein